MADDLIFVTDLVEAKIWSGTVNPLSLVEVPQLTVSEPTAIDYDPVDERIYWTDRELHTINRAYMNGSSQEVVIELSISSGSYNFTHFYIREC